MTLAFLESTVGFNVAQFVRLVETKAAEVEASGGQALTLDAAE